MRDTGEGLPELLAEVARATSRATAEKLARAFGGRVIYVPARLRPDHPLVEALGPEDAAAVCRLLGSGEVLIPLGPAADFARRTQAIARCIAEGRSIAETVKATGAHERTVRRYRERLRDGRQGDLFAAVDENA